MARRYLLSIDGGGIRGIIPAVALLKLERTTGRLARDIFSFVAGTSTGAIIAAGIAAGIPMERILNIYLNRAREVFPQRPWKVLQRIVAGYMYPVDVLHHVILDELGAARDWAMNDSPIDLLITAKRVRDGKPWYFVRDSERNSRRVGQIRLAEAVVASAAAPTFFQPWTIREDPLAARGEAQPIGALVDGGVGVTGNPVYEACVEAFYYTGTFDPNETVVVSLGTGRFVSHADPRWIGAWLGWLLGELTRSPGEQQTEIVHRHFTSTPLYRLDPDLRRLDPQLNTNIELDDANQAERLRQYGERFAQQIDWEAILDITDTRFRISDDSTTWYEYSAT